MNRMSRATCVLGAAAVVLLAGCGSDDKTEPIGDPLSSAAKGELATNGGAARLGGDGPLPHHDRRAGRQALRTVAVTGGPAAVRG